MSKLQTSGFGRDNFAPSEADLFVAVQVLQCMNTCSHFSGNSYNYFE